MAAMQAVHNSVTMSIFPREASRAPATSKVSQYWQAEVFQQNRTKYGEIAVMIYMGLNGYEEFIHEFTPSH
jgi:hypothetical protein